MDSINLDHNSTTPLLPAVWDAMRPFAVEQFGNPASAHHLGRRARRALEDARSTVASLLGAQPAEVLFTSGATESNNLAIFGLAGPPPGRLACSPIEHPSVIEPINHLTANGFDVEWLTVDATGVVQPSVHESARLLCLMLANHEMGALQPVAQLARKGLLHCDAVQAVGKVPVDFRSLGAATLSLSGHKFHGPKGIGVLLARQDVKLRPLHFGGHQQRGQRPGTEPVALAVGLATALEIACREMAQRTAHVQRLRQAFLDGLRGSVNVVLNGPTEGGIPHTLNLSFPGCQADLLLINLDLAGVACSTGSACSSGSLLPSPVLKAMKVSEENLTSAIRFSFSAMLTLGEVEEAVVRTVEVVKRLP